jgi:cellulose synthase/poly-beta-1,6-N-acetylglucosamine synthase-like glycosyltransferase
MNTGLNTTLHGLLAIGLAAPAYTYFVYPVLLLLLAAARQLRRDVAHATGTQQRRALDLHPDQWPTVAVLVAAYNEERHIAPRVANLLQSDYPAHLLRVYVGSDASSDATEQLMKGLVQAHPERVVFLPFSQRRGKPSVINDLAAQAQAEILVFTDANTAFDPNAIKAMVRHLVQDTGIGCVSGELRMISPQGSDNQDHVYWRYERMLKFFENRLGALLGANGGVYALRRAQYQPIAPDTIVDDFCIAAGLMLKGLRCHYEPAARATEETPPRLSDEFPRRVRIGMGNYQALARYAGLMHPRQGYVALAFVSHKLLRWFVPHCLLLALVCTVLLLPQGWPYAALLAAQGAFYAVAWWGWRAGRSGSVPRVARIPVFFTSMNLALFLGHWRYLRGGIGGAWARSAR